MTGRVAAFWSRAGGIYAAYKVRQVQHAALRLLGRGPGDLEEALWTPHHEWAGREMFRLCVDLRGFYLKAGQFLGARPDFLPRPVCEALSRLHDQVPPMPAAQARAAIEDELGGRPLESVFEWVDLDAPLGSASIAQVHKARLRADFDPESVIHWRSVAEARAGGGRGGGERSPTNPVVAARAEAQAALAELDGGGDGARGRRVGPSRAPFGSVTGAARGRRGRDRGLFSRVGSDGVEAMGITVCAEEVFVPEPPAEGAHGQTPVPPEDPERVKRLPGAFRVEGWLARVMGAGKRTAAEVESVVEGGASGAAPGGPARGGAGGLVVTGGGGAMLDDYSVPGDQFDRVRPGPGRGAGQAPGKAGKARKAQSEHAGQVVAVKVQYPNALPLMRSDLAQIRRLAAFLSRFEIKFDMTSAVDELGRQIEGEFDFDKEARVMASIANTLAPLRGKVQVPRPVPGLVTGRLLAMDFIDGVQVGRAPAVPTRRPAWRPSRPPPADRPTCAPAPPSNPPRADHQARGPDAGPVGVPAAAGGQGSADADQRGLRAHDPEGGAIPGGLPPGQHPRDEGGQGRAHRLWTEQAAHHGGGGRVCAVGGCGDGAPGRRRTGGAGRLGPRDRDRADG